MKIKKIAVVVLSIIAVFTASFSFSFQTKAAQEDKYTFSVPYPEPYCSDNAGYITLLLSSNNTPSDYFVYTYFWNIVPQGHIIESGSANVSCEMQVEVTSNSLKLKPKQLGAASAYVNLCEYTASNDFYCLANGIVSLNSYEYTESWSGYTIHGYLFGGNVTDLNRGNYWTVPEVHWSDSVDNSQLIYRLAQLESLYGANNDLTRQSNVILEQVLEALDNTKASQAGSDLSGKAEETGQAVTEYKDKETEALNGVDLETVDVDPFSIVSTDSMYVYVQVLGAITSQPLVLTMMTLGVSFALVAFVLFGKR